MADQAVAEVQASLTSLAAGGQVRARVDDAAVAAALVGQRVLAFDDLAEMQVYATVDHIDGAFMYLAPEWSTVADYTPRPLRWSDVYSIQFDTIVGVQEFTRAPLQSADVGVAEFAGIAGTGPTLSMAEPVFRPGMSVTIEAGWGEANPASLTYALSGATTTLKWNVGAELAPVIQIYRVVPPDVRRVASQAVGE